MLISLAKTHKAPSTVICTHHWFSPIWGFGDQFPTPGWLHRVTDWILASTGVAGDLRDEWALPGVTVAPASFPCCPAAVCPFLSSYLSVQCNLTQGAVPLLLRSPRCRPPSLAVSGVTVKREWPAWVELELGWLTESWHPIVGATVSASCHPQLPTLWPPRHQGRNAPSQWATQPDREVIPISLKSCKDQRDLVAARARGTCWCSCRAFWLAEWRLNGDPVGTETCTSSNCLGLIKPTSPPAASNQLLLHCDSDWEKNLIAESEMCRVAKMFGPVWAW